MKWFQLAVAVLAVTTALPSVAEDCPNCYQCTQYGIGTDSARICAQFKTYMTACEFWAWYRCTRSRCFRYKLRSVCIKERLRPGCQCIRTTIPP